MPYTPPSHRSPASSAQSSPETSRRSSLQTSDSKPSLPRSSSYLSRHRRTPSAVACQNGSVEAPPHKPQELRRSVTTGAATTAAVPNACVRQSPPPVTGDQGMPKGAMISPPESTASSDDDDLPELRGRKLESSKVKELHQAVSRLSHGRAASPDKQDHHVNTNSFAPQQQPKQSQQSATTTPSASASVSASSSAKATAPSSLSTSSSSQQQQQHQSPPQQQLQRHLPQSVQQPSFDTVPHSFSTGALERLGQSARNSSSSPSSSLSHSRSATEPNIMISKSPETSNTVSDEDLDPDEEIRRKPPMVRKKSGELVRPALRPSSHRRPSSMPGTPTFGKAVHFDSHLEHVRHFLQVDRPLAVSAGSSPVEAHDSDTEFPFNETEQSGTRSPPYEWELIMTNFPSDSPYRRAQPVRLEKVCLSADQKSLVGSVAVENISFHKNVTCRFTLDYWKTTSEVAAGYVSPVTPRVGLQDHDRFQFTIKLSDMVNLESKTLFFCVRFSVTGRELWDNNGGANFQVDFRKKMLPQNGKNGFRGASSRPLNSTSNGSGTTNALPRSNRRSNSIAGSLPRNMPISANEFGDSSRVNLDHSFSDYLGDPDASSTIRLKGVKGNSSLEIDNLSSRLGAPSGQAFANRYDFGASLSAAMQSAKDGIPSKPEEKPRSMQPPQKMRPHTMEFAPNGGAPPMRSAAPPVASPPTQGSPVSASIASSSYEELVSKYCFFGTKPSNPQGPSGRFDGADDSSLSHSASHFGGNFAPHHGQHQPSYLGPYHGHPQANPYPQNRNGFVAWGSSPADSPGASPEQRHSPNRPSSPSANQTLGLSSSPQGQASGRSGSPSSIADAFAQFSTPSSGSEMSFQHMHERFPFSGNESHAATAIKG